MKRSNKFFQKIFYNWQVKCLSFLLAVFVFFMLTMSIQETRTVTLPLDIKMPEGYTVDSNVPESVELTIKGTEDKIYMIDISKISVSADFSSVDTAGVTSSPVKIDTSGLQDFLDVKSVSVYTTPSVVRIYFSEKGK